VLTVAALAGGVLAASVLFEKQIIAAKQAKLAAPPVTLGVQADFSLSLAKPDGTAGTLEEFRGRPLFLHFWSPNCPGCLAELAGLNALFRQTGGSEVAFVSVALGDEADVRRALTGYTAEFPVYRHEGALPPVYGSGVPSTFIVDRNGALALKHAGPAKWDDPSVAALLEVLASAPASPDE
jgi:peroxiredoxin